MIGYYIIAALCGVAVAGAEILSRYKDEPFKAIQRRWSLYYLILNALLSAAAFAIFVAAGTVKTTTSDFDTLKFALFAGFGAVVVMRAKLFNLKLEGGEKLGIGPDFVIDSFLSAIDRQTDRQRAYERANIVKQAMGGIDFTKALMPITVLLTRSMQNITPAEMTEFGQKVKELESEAKMSNQEKSYGLGFEVLDLGGEDFFIKVFDDKERQKYKVAPPAPGG